MKILTINEFRLQSFKHLDAFGVCDIISVSDEQDLPIPVLRYLDWVQEKFDTLNIIAKTPVFEVIKDSRKVSFCGTLCEFNGINIVIELYSDNDYNMSFFSFNESIYNLIIKTN